MAVSVEVESALVGLMRVDTNGGRGSSVPVSVKQELNTQVQNSFLIFLQEKLLLGKQRPFYSSPRLRQFWDEEHEEFESWTELFFDLIYVAMAFELGTIIDEVMISEEYDDLFGSFFGQFLPMYAVWCSRTSYLSQFKCNSYFHIALDMAYAMFVAFMALFIGTNDQIRVGFGETSVLGNETGTNIILGGFRFLADTSLSAEINYNTLLGFSVSFFMCQVIDLFRGIEMGCVTAKKGIRSELHKEMKKRQRKAIVLTSFRTITRQLFTMSLTAVAIVAAYNRNESVALKSLFFAVMVSLLFFFLVDVFRRCIRSKDISEMIPLNNAFMIKRTGEFFILMLGEGVLQITISAINNDQFSSHLTSYGIAFAVLGVMQFIIFYTLPYEEDEHAIVRGGVPSFLIQISTPFANGALIFLGVSLKLVLKKHAELDKPKNRRLQFLLAYSLLACNMIFIFQSLVHSGMSKILLKDSSPSGKRNRSWNNFNLKRSLFSCLYFLSPFIFLSLIMINLKGPGTLSISILFLGVIIGLGQLESHMYTLKSDHEKNKRIISTIFSEFAGNVNRDTKQMARMTKHLLDMRLSGRPFSNVEEDELKEGIANSKSQITKTLMFMRDKSHLMESAVTQGKALEKSRVELESLLEHVEELQVVVNILRDNIEAVVPIGGEEPTEFGASALLSKSGKSAGKSSKQISRRTNKGVAHEKELPEDI